MNNKNKKTNFFLIFAALMLVAVIAVLLANLLDDNKKPEPVTETTRFSAYAETVTAFVPAVTTGAPAAETAAPAAAEAKKDDLAFASLPDRFTFTSGVGGWATDLWLNDDGSFGGQFFDSDMGVHQYYFCNFNGQFAAPVRLNDYSWSLKIVQFETNHELNGGVDDPQAEFIESGPYGLEKAKELILYMPGTALSLMPEDSIAWLHLSGNETGLPAGRYALYNAAEGYAFVNFAD